ncbi:MAG: hypothetical protein M1817_001094 [Caeruleum heppii]|nr:MAG: hypothetical protein M1817_001094 [Caeruleum heppii]
MSSRPAFTHQILLLLQDLKHHTDIWGILAAVQLPEHLNYFIVKRTDRAIYEHLMATQFAENAGIEQSPLALWRPTDQPGEDVDLTKEKPTSDKWNHWRLFDDDPNTFEGDIPSNVRLSDLTVAYVIANSRTKERGEKWPCDFAKTGEVRRTRPNNGAPAIATDNGLGRYLVAFGFYQLIGGSNWNKTRTFLGTKIRDTKWDKIKHLSLGDFADGPPVTRAQKRAVETGEPTAPPPPTKRIKAKAVTNLAVRAPTPFYAPSQRPKNPASDSPATLPGSPPQMAQRSSKILLSPAQLVSKAKKPSLSPQVEEEDLYSGSPIQKSIEAQEPIKPFDKSYMTTEPSEKAFEGLSDESYMITKPGIKIFEAAEKPSDILARHHRRQSRVAEMWQDGLEDMAKDIARLRSRGL